MQKVLYCKFRDEKKDVNETTSKNSAKHDIGLKNVARAAKKNRDTHARRYFVLTLALSTI